MEGDPKGGLCQDVLRNPAGGDTPAPPSRAGQGAPACLANPEKIRTLTGTRWHQWSGLNLKLTGQSSRVVPDLTKKVLWRYLQEKTKTEGVGSVNPVAAAVTCEESIQVRALAQSKLHLGKFPALGSTQVSSHWKKKCF